MAVTLPQKYVEWTVTMLSATAVMAPCDTACVQSSIGAVPFQSRSKSWSCSTRCLLLLVSALARYAGHAASTTSATARDYGSPTPRTNGLVWRIGNQTQSLAKCTQSSTENFSGSTSRLQFITVNEALFTLSFWNT